MLNVDALSKIEDNLYYLPSETTPILSADIGVFIGGKFIWCYDCGASTKACDFLGGLDKTKLVISHFHKDHTDNNIRLNNVDEYFVSKYTGNHIHKGTVITEDKYYEDDGLVHILPMPNSHCKGSLAMEINEKYVFVGDSLYGKHIDNHLAYNSQLLYEQIKVLTKIKADKILVSHEASFITDKSIVLSKLEKILTKRKSGEPWIIL